MWRDRKHGRERQALTLFTVLSLILCLPALLLFPNIFLLIPLLSIASNASTIYLIAIHFQERVRNLFIKKYYIITFFSYLLLLNILYAIVLIFLRAAPDADTAMYLGIPILILLYLILIGLIDILLIFPENIVSKAVRNTIRYSLFFVSMLFLVPTYAYSVFFHTYDSNNLEKIHGVFPELMAIQMGFGDIRPISAVFFIIALILILLSATIQFISIKNETVKHYYRIMWVALVLSSLISLFAILIFGAIFRINYFFFYSLETIIFSPAVAYYFTHIHILKKQIANTNIGKDAWGEIVIYVRDGPEDIRKAKEYFIEQIKGGKRSMIFSVEDPSLFFPEKQDILDSTLYIQLTKKGYMVNNKTLFRNIEDLLHVYSSTMSNFRGVIVYGNTLHRLVQEKTSPEKKLKFYLLYQKMIRDGALIISPIEREYLEIDTERKIIRTKYPAWHIKPLMSLRFQELINIIYSAIPDEKKESFVTELFSMKRELPRMEFEDSYISVDLTHGIDSEAFISLVENVRNMVVSKNFMKEKDFDRLMGSLFSKYQDDYEATILIKKGAIYFINGKNPENACMEKAAVMAARGRSLLIISRTNPEILKKRYAFEGDVRVKWLTNLPEGKEVITPHLESIKKDIFDFADTQSDAVVVLDGIEYLVRIHGFSPILELLWMLKDKVALTDSSVIIPVNLGALEERNAETLRREFQFI